MNKTHKKRFYQFQYKAIFLINSQKITLILFEATYFIKNITQNQCIHLNEKFNVKSFQLKLNFSLKRKINYIYCELFLPLIINFILTVIDGTVF